MVDRIMPPGQTVLNATDLAFGEFQRTVCEIVVSDGHRGVIIGPKTIQATGISQTVAEARQAHPRLTVIYDLPDGLLDGLTSAEATARTLKQSRTDAVILPSFPRRKRPYDYWVPALQAADVRAIVGTDQAAGLEQYDDRARLNRRYTEAITAGVRDFLIPDPDPEIVSGYRKFFEEELGLGSFALFVSTNSANFETMNDAAGPNWHPIVQPKSV